MIGNFGDGTINAFNLMTGKHEGTMLDDTTGKAVFIDGLWALSFGGDATNNGLATSSTSPLVRTMKATAS